MNPGVRMVVTVAALIFVTPVLVSGAPVIASLSTGINNDVSVAIAVADDGVSGSSPAGQSQPRVYPRNGRVQGATPKVELFLGYSYLRAVPSLSAGNRLVWLNGGSTSIAFNVKHFLGLVGDFGGFADSELNVTGPGANPARIADSGGNAYTYLFGPRFSDRKHERLVPFAQVLAGGIHASQVTLSGCTGAACIPLPAQNAFALTAGAGLDLKIHQHVSLRLVQAEYLMTRFADPATGNKSLQNDVRLSGGVVLSSGGTPALLPVAYTCVATPASGFAGDPVSVTGTVLNLNPKRTPAYGWRVDGGKISGTSEVASVDTAGVTPGNYTAQGHVSESGRHGRFADCSAPFTVMTLQPPTVSCSADPSTGHPGEPISITAQGVSPQNRPLTYRYSTSEGSIQGNATTATLTTAGVTSQPITVTCTVTDDKQQTASATAMVTVAPVPIPPAPPTQKLCSIHFERDRKRPTRVDNEGKACLDEIALNLQRSSDATLAFEGSGDARAAAQRAINAMEYLVTEKGIDASRVMAYTTASDSKTVDAIMIPSGATLDRTGLTLVDGSMKPIARSLGGKRQQ